jgi:16S rRNA (uracil1498-N3)-methyltransferase
VIAGPASARAAAHVLVDNVEQPELRPPDRHHLERVLRVRPGTEITVGDGVGAWRVVRLAPTLDPVGPVLHVAEETHPIAIGCALTKGDKPELAVQKLTELGVDRIILFPSARSVVRWDDGRVEANMERLRRVVDSAVCQCRRAWSPTVAYLASYSSAVLLTGVAVAAADGKKYDPDRHHVILVGPEGGWSPEELAVSVPRVVLGPHILRAETAALAAGSVACAARYYRT